MHDVIVVGAGPSGAVAAQQLAVRGHRPRLMERAPALPRERACAGLATGAVIDFLERLGLEVPARVVDARIDRITINVAGGSTLSADVASGELTSIRRSRFDHALVDQAVRAGARLELGRRVDAIEPRPGGGFDVRVGDEVESCRYLVLATGPRDTLTAALGDTSPPDGMGVALDLDASRLDLDPHGLEIEIGSVPRGFFWVLPSGRHLSVGLISTELRVPGSRRLLHAFLERRGLAAAGVLSNVTDLVSSFTAGDRPWRPGLVRVGDQLGVVDPLTGLGLSGAVRSGQWAAEAIDRALARGGPDPAQVVERRRKSLAGEHRVAAKIADVAYRRPARFLEAVAGTPDRGLELGRCAIGRRSYATLRRFLFPTAFGRLLRRVDRG